MNKEFILEKWIPALRSGEYKQGKDALHKSGEFCCLGVACDLLIKDGLLTDWEKWKGAYGIPNIEEIDKLDELFPEPPGYRDYVHQTVVLPDRVAKYLGIPAFGVEIPIHGYEYVSLAELNDNGKSFEEIADYLEDYVNRH